MPAWRYPFVWAVVGLVAGILLSEAPLYAAVGAGIGLFGLSAYFWFALKWGRIVWALPFFASLGWLRAWIEKYTSPLDIRQQIGHLVTLSGFTVEEPTRTRRAYRLLVEVDSLYLYRWKTTILVKGRVLLYTKDSVGVDIPPGMRIHATCRLDSLRYGTAYWHKQGVFVSCFSEKVESAGIEKNYWRGYLQRLRYELIQTMNETAPAKGVALAAVQALLLGYKRGLDPEVQSAFQLSGTAHILAVSGMHVGLVLSLWLFLLNRLPAGWSHHWISQTVLLGLVVFYGFLTGASPSAMRAVIMGSIAILARMMYQTYSPLNALAFAAFLQNAADPQVIYQLGFQLSYAAVGGIMAFYAPLQAALLKIFPRGGTLLRYFQDLIAISLAAQVGTFFLSWAYFGRFPLYFLLANLIAVPLATATAFAAVGWVILLPIPMLDHIGGYVAYALAWLLVESVRLVSLLPGGSLSLPSLPPGVGVALTLLVLVGGGVWMRKVGRSSEPSWLA